MTPSHSAAMAPERGPSKDSNIVKPGRMLPFLGVVLLSLLCLKAFGQALGFGFLAFDDDINISLNPHMGPLSWERLRWAFVDLSYVHRYMPLGWTGLSAIYSASGLSPLGYHLAALALHTVNTLLVWRIAIRLLSQAVPQIGAQRRQVAGLLAAAWWGVHPQKVELAAWSSGILNLQADVFLLLALLAVVEAAAAQTEPGRLRGNTIGLFCYILSLLSYPVGLGAVDAVLAVDLALARKPMQPWPDLACALRRRVPWILAAAACALVNVIAEASPMGRWSSAGADGLGLLPVPGHLLACLVARKASLAVACRRHL